MSSGFMLRLVSCGDFEVWCSDFVVDICVYKTVGFITKWIVVSYNIICP